MLYLIIIIGIIAYGCCYGYDSNKKQNTPKTQVVGLILFLIAGILFFIFTGIGNRLIMWMFFPDI
jgi:multisubunit Na+/H+ antiporter MnhB subunit